MRFKDFLKEAFNEYTFDEIIPLIKRDCASFISESRGRPLFRGISGIKSSTKSTHPAGRKPLDSTQDFNLVFNAGCELAFGIEEVRKRSIFVSGNNEDANYYGEVTFFYPIGKIKYLWSTTIKDSGVMYGKITSSIIDNLTDLSGVKYAPAAVTTGFNKMSAFYDAPELIKGIRNKDKDVLEKIAYFFKITDESFPNFLLDAIEKTFSKLYTSKGLSTAILKHKEILVYQTAGYYSLERLTVINKMEAEGLKPGQWDFVAMHSFINEKLDSL